MTRKISAPTAAETAKVITQPGYLVEFGFSIPIRYSTRGDILWNTQPWISADVDVGSIRELPDGSVSLNLSVGNTDLAFGALCLNEGVQEKVVKIWAFYQGALAADDPLLLFEGVIDSSEITEQKVSLKLSAQNMSTLYIPRLRITRASGFNHLMPAGTVINLGSVRVEIKKD